MSDTPETDDQPIIYAMNDNGYQVPCVDLEFAQKLERERDEAIFFKNTSSADFLKQIDKITLCKDVAREKLLIAEKELGETRRQFVDFVDQTEDYKSQRDEAIKAIIETLDENRHLADGDDCTLRKLKAIVPDWE